MQVLAQAVMQGTVWSSSVALPLQSEAITGTLSLASADQHDPQLSIGLTLEAALGHGLWTPFACATWQGGPIAGIPTIEAQAVAARVRLVLDLSRPVSVGATITYQ
jgi:hypothetical protein